MLRWKLANDDGRFVKEISPVTLKTKKGTEEFKVDEHPKQTSMEKMAKLPPVFKKNGTVHAGNASVSLFKSMCFIDLLRNEMFLPTIFSFSQGICDGAGAVVLASEDAVKANNFSPLVKILGYHVSGGFLPFTK